MSALLLLLDRARSALRIALSCRSRDLRGRHAVAAREHVEAARAAGADVAEIERELEVLEAQLRQEVLW